MRRRVRKISLFGWLTLCLIKFEILFVKIEYEEEFRMSEANLFHSTHADGKYLGGCYLNIL